MMNFEIAAFYKFVAIPDFASLRKPVADLCDHHGVCGTILLAAEGINGTIAGSPAGIAAMMAGLRAIPAFSDLRHKTSFASGKPFQRMKVRLKTEIVRLGVPGVGPNEAAGTYVEPQDWNALISDPEVLVIDTRNAFEVAAGTFKGAIDPGTASFAEFPAFARKALGDAKHRKIAMFCTGGIRCEKATSFLLGEGFEQVFHLKGGILNYLETVPPEASLWSGKCFVFDERGAVGHGLEPWPQE